MLWILLLGPAGVQVEANSNSNNTNEQGRRSRERVGERAEGPSKTGTGGASYFCEGIELGINPIMFCYEGRIK